MAYHVDDIPAESITVDPPETIALEDYDDASAFLIDPAGTSTPLDAAVDAGVIVVDFPTSETVFPLSGIYRLRVTLTAVGGYAQALPEVPIVVVDPDDQWHTVESIRLEWPDAEFIPDASLWEILEVAKGQVLEFAPVLLVDVPIPIPYRTAQRIQSRNIWNAAKVAPDGTAGMDDFVIRPFPLDWHVKQILRPKRAIGGVA